MGKELKDDINKEIHQQWATSTYDLLSSPLWRSGGPVSRFNWSEGLLITWVTSASRVRSNLMCVPSQFSFAKTLRSDREAISCGARALPPLSLLTVSVHHSMLFSLNLLKVAISSQLQWLFYARFHSYFLRWVVSHTLFIYTITTQKHGIRVFVFYSWVLHRAEEFNRFGRGESEWMTYGLDYAPTSIDSPIFTSSGFWQLHALSEAYYISDLMQLFQSRTSTHVFLLTGILHDTTFFF